MRFASAVATGQSSLGAAEVPALSGTLQLPDVQLGAAPVHLKFVLPRGSGAASLQVLANASRWGQAAAGRRACGAAACQLFLPLFHAAACTQLPETTGTTRLLLRLQGGSRQLAAAGQQHSGRVRSGWAALPADGGRPFVPSGSEAGSGRGSGGGGAAATRRGAAAGCGRRRGAGQAAGAEPEMRVVPPHQERNEAQAHRAVGPRAAAGRLEQARLPRRAARGGALCLPRCCPRACRAAASLRRLRCRPRAYCTPMAPPLC